MKFKDHENFKRITLKLYKNKVGIIIIFLALSPKWPFEISKIAKFTAKLFILLKANFKINGLDRKIQFSVLKIFMRHLKLCCASKLCAMIGLSPEDSDLFE